MSISVARKARKDFGGKSSNAVLVMNGREGRVTISLRRVCKGGGKKQTRAQLSWFPPALDLATSKVFNRMVGQSVAHTFVEAHKLDPAAAYQFSLDMVRTPGQSVNERMQKWLSEERAKGAKYQRVDPDALTNAPARVVSGGRTA